MPVLSKQQILAAFARHCVSVIAEMGSHEVVGSTIECSHHDGRIIILERTSFGWSCGIGGSPAKPVQSVDDLDRILQVI